jgi:hypothetical protein
MASLADEGLRKADFSLFKISPANCHSTNVPQSSVSRSFSDRLPIEAVTTVSTSLHSYFYSNIPCRLIRVVQPPMLRVREVNRPGPEADHSSPTNAEVKENADV